MIWVFVSLMCENPAQLLPLNRRPLMTGEMLETARPGISGRRTGGELSS